MPDAIQLRESMGNQEGRRRLQGWGIARNSHVTVFCLSMFCPPMEVVRRNAPRLIDPEPSERNLLKPTRSPVVNRAAPNSLRPAVACRPCKRALRPSGTGNGTDTLASMRRAASCIKLPGHPEHQLRLLLPRGAAASALCRIGALLAPQGSSYYLSFRRPLSGGSKL